MAMRSRQVTKLQENKHKERHNLRSKAQEGTEDVRQRRQQMFCEVDLNCAGRGFAWCGAEATEQLQHALHHALPQKNIKLCTAVRIMFCIWQSLNHPLHLGSCHCVHWAPLGSRRPKSMAPHGSQRHAPSKCLVRKLHKVRSLFPTLPLMHWTCGWTVGPWIGCHVWIVVHKGTHFFKV